MRSEEELHDITLHALGDQLKIFTPTFSYITFNHVYRELIVITNNFLKEGLSKTLGTLHFKEFKDGNLQVYN